MSDKKFIDIEKLIESKNPRLLRLLPGFILSYLKRILHEKEINDFLAIHHEKKNQDFCDEVMKYFNIDVQIHGIENIPKSGPVILAMNHPLGGMDGIAFISAIGAYRKDIKFIVNDILMNLENLTDLFVGVNKHGKNKMSVRKQINFELLWSGRQPPAEIHRFFRHLKSANPAFLGFAFKIDGFP